MYSIDFRTGKANLRGVAFRGKQGYLPGLTGLRAVCAFTVIACHTMPGIVPHGSLGVDVFFVLSGLLITRLLMREVEAAGQIDLPRFYLRRSARLWPALLLVVAACTGYGLVKHVEGREIAGSSFAAAFYVMNWAKALSLGPDGWLGHTWSLAVEEQFYLVWPLLLTVFLGVRRSWRLPLFASALGLAALWPLTIALMGASEARIYNGFDTRAVGLLFGCALGLLPAASRLWAWAGKTWAIPAVMLAAGAALGYADTPLNVALQIPATALLAAWLIAGIQTTPPRVLEHRTMRYLGEISYGVYLWHYPLSVQLASHVSFPLARLVLVSAASVLAAAVSHRLIEGPIRVWAAAAIDRLPRRLVPSAAGA